MTLKKLFPGLPGNGDAGERPDYRRSRRLEELFAVGSEIVIADTPGDVISALSEMPESDWRAIGARPRRRVLAEHTANRRIDQLESLLGVAA